MLSPSLLSKAHHISHDVFSDEKHARVWGLVCKAIFNGVETNSSTLLRNYREEVTSLGGIDVLEEFREIGKEIQINPAPSMQELFETYQWRKIKQLSKRLETLGNTHEKSPEDTLSNIIQFSQGILANGQDSAMSKRTIAQKAVNRAQEKRELVTTGITSLDFLMQGGLQKKRLYGIGGVYGRGKTILLGTISDNLNSQSVPHLFISLETDPEDIELRTCARHFNTNASLLADPNAEHHDDAKLAAQSYIDETPEHTWYEFSPGATMNEIHRMILRAKTRHNIQGVIIDYWQLIEGKERGQGEDAHHRSNANRLAALCRQEDMWCLLTAQIDLNGKLKYSDSLLSAAAFYMRMLREEDEEEVHFEVQKSNYTRYGSTFSTSLPSVLFDMAAGPHIRDTSSMDMGRLGDEEDDSKIDI